MLALALLLAGLLTIGYRGKSGAIRANPVAWLAAALFCLYLIACTYSIGNQEDMLTFLGKAARLMFIPLLLIVFRMPTRAAAHGTDSSQRCCLPWFCLTCCGWGCCTKGHHQGRRRQPNHFQAAYHHNLFMAFTAFVCAVQARYAATPRQRGIWIALALLAAFNVLFMVQGRTGHLVLLVLLVYMGVVWLRWRGSPSPWPQSRCCRIDLCIALQLPASARGLGIPRIFRRAARCGGNHQLIGRPAHGILPQHAGNRAPAPAAGRGNWRFQASLRRSGARYRPACHPQPAQ